MYSSLILYVIYVFFLISWLSHLLIIYSLGDKTWSSNQKAWWECARQHSQHTHTQKHKDCRRLLITSVMLLTFAWSEFIFSCICLVNRDCPGSRKHGHRHSDRASAAFVSRATDSGPSKELHWLVARGTAGQSLEPYKPYEDYCSLFLFF